MRMLVNKQWIFITSICLWLISLGSCASRRNANSDYPKPQNAYVPAGELREVFYRSTEPKMTKRHAFVYLPKGYSDSQQHFPVLYLLHGARGNETVWIDKADLLRDIDSLTLCGAMPPTIVVLPNMNQYNSDKDFGNSRLKGAWESFYEVDGTVEAAFIHDVVTATDSMFRTIPTKNSRAIAGLSIGAMQSIHISANFPNAFGYVGIFSPMVHKLLKPGKNNGFFYHLKRKQKAQFSEPPSLYFIRIGRRDIFYHTVRRYCKYLDRRGYSYDINYSSGGHNWYNWKNFCREFLTKLWKEN